MLIGFPPVFVADTKIIYRYNFVAPLTKDKLPSCGTTVIKLLLYGDDSLVSVANALILNASVDFILSSKRFDGPLL